VAGRTEKGARQAARPEGWGADHERWWPSGTRGKAPPGLAGMGAPHG